MLDFSCLRHRGVALYCAAMSLVAVALIVSIGMPNGDQRRPAMPEDSKEDPLVHLEGLGEQEGRIGVNFNDRQARPSEPSSEPENPTEVALLFSNPGGDPCPLVKCRLQMPGASISERELVSDELGLLFLDAEGCRGSCLTVLDERYAIEVVRFALSVESQYQIFLQPATRLEGRVILPNGASPESGKILAWELGQMASSEFHERPDFGALDIGSFVTDLDAEGRFSIGGVRAGGYYGLVAVGPGFVTYSTELNGPVLAPSRDALVRAGYLYGLELNFVDGIGEPVDVVNGLYARTGIEGRESGDYMKSIFGVVPVKPLDPSMTLLLPGQDWGALLLGSDEVFSDHPGTVPLIYASMEDRQRFDAEVAFDIAGFETVDTIVNVSRMSGLDEMDSEAIALSPSGLQVGSLSVSIVDAMGSGRARRLEQTSCLKLFLNDPSSELGSGIAIELGWDDYPRWRIEGIPCGSYILTVRSSDGGWSKRCGIVDVSSIGEEHVEVSAADAGSVRVSLSTESGTPYLGPATICLAKMVYNEQFDREVLTVSHTADQMFVRGPYEFPLVESGDWVVVVSQPPTRGGGQDGRYEAVHVSTGVLSEVALRTIRIAR